MCIRDRYGLISYWTAYLKTHYPVEFMAALLQGASTNKDKTALYLGEARRMGIDVYKRQDFNDVNAILRGAGTALFGIGSARGEDRATQAAEIAISSPLLEESIEGAHGALINIAGPTDLKLQEAAAAVALVQKAIHPEAQIIWGLSLDDAYGDEVRVTVIAAGFDANSKKPDQPAEEKPAAAKENTVPLSALSAGVQAPAQQPQPVQTPAVPQVQPLSSYIPSTRCV